MNGPKIIKIARVCHEANRAYCESLDDLSQKPWACAEEWQKVSAYAGVNFHLDNPNADDAASHENWLKDKIADGWRYGAVKDTEAKTHPCCIPFDLLPIEQQRKDRLFRAIVHALA